MTISISYRKTFHGEVLSSALANNTRIAYDKGWRCFEDYCAEKKINPFSPTPEQAANFVTAHPPPSHRAVF